MKKYAYILFFLSLACLTLHAQDSYKVKGTVIDFVTSQPVAKASVTVRGSVLQGSETLDDGSFVIEVPSLYSVLVIKYPGYQPKNFTLAGKEEVSISIFIEGWDVGESEVRLPYYSVNEKDLNGVYRVISKGYDKNTQQRNINQLLGGAIPGLNINAYSGVPGEGSMLSLGGVRSIYSNNDPLLIVDGLAVNDPMFKQSVVRGNIYNSLEDINVKDIESITILRDASASGIYGSKAANGALVITTKEGAEKTYFDVSVQLGLSPRFKELPVLDASEYLTLLSEKIDNQGLSQNTISNNFPFYSSLNPNTVAYRRYANNTNWQKEITRNAFSQDYYLNLRGGDATSKYSYHVGYNTTDGVGKGISVNRFTSRFNLDFSISKKLSAGTRIAFSRTGKLLMDQGFEERVNPLFLSLAKAPILAPYQRSAEGVAGPFFDKPSFDNLSNPVAVVNGVMNEANNYWILGSVFAKFQFNRALSTKIQFSLDRRGLEEDRFTPSNGIIAVNLDPLYDRTSEEQMVNRAVTTVEHTLIYDKQLSAEHRLLILGGYNIETSSYKSTYGYSVHSTSDDFTGLGDGQKVLMKDITEAFHNVSAFASADYSYRNKLFLKAGLRMDGSSKFGADVKGTRLFSIPVAVLPYTGITWKVKQESWMRKFSFIDELNLRASLGITANQNIPVGGRYSLYQSTFYLSQPGMVPYSLGNKEIKWETTHNFNAGANISLFKKAVGLQVDYFATRTTDLLMPLVANGETGINSYWGNAGTLNNQGIELGLNTLGHCRKFFWNVGLSFAKYINKVVELPNGLPIIDGVYGYSSIVQEGKPAGLIYGYKGVGVFSTQAEATAANLADQWGVAYKAGDFHYSDLNGDHIIDNADRQVVGNPNPDFFGAVKANFAYKNFSLDANFSYSFGNEILNVLREKLETGSAYENQLVTVLNKWRTDGDITTIPNTKFSYFTTDKPASSEYIEDGSYFKLSSLTLTYSLKKRISFVRGADIYISGYNLFTLTKYLGWDPEVAIGQNLFTRGYDFGNYPQPKTIMLGIRLGL